jgi:hypothetical protein
MMDQDKQKDELAMLVVRLAIHRVDQLPTVDFSNRVRQLSDTIREIGSDVTERALVKLRIAVQETKLDKPRSRKQRAH